MENKTLKQMMGSEKYRIVAAVLEVMEKTQFDSQQETVMLQVTDSQEGETEKWKMVFQKRNTDIDEINGIQRELGKNFFIRIDAKDRAALQVVIEAPCDDFIALLQRKQNIPDMKA